MKHISNRDYTDLVLNKHVDKGAILEEEYEKANIVLTKERIEYLVVVRGIYTPAVDESEVKGIEGVDEIPEGEKVLDEVIITSDEETKQEETEENPNNDEETTEEDKTEKDPVTEEVETEEASKEDESKTDEQTEKEETSTEEDNSNPKNNKKGNKNTQKNK